MKKWLLGIILVAAVAGGSLMAYRQRTGQEQKDRALPTELVQRRDIASVVQATGVIRPRIGAEVKVGARISGRVEKLYANIGDVVEKGQLIARIEQDDLRAKVNEARMNLRAAEANLELSRKTLARMESLFAKDFVARDRVDVAEKDHKAAQAQVNQIKETISFHTTQLSYADIHAPIRGVIASVATQQGETVSASSLNVPTFVTIVDLDRLEVYAYVDETDIGRIKPGLEAAFSVDSYPESEFKGSVSAIYPKATIQDNVVYYITVIAIENPAGKLKPDMTVNATLHLDKRNAVLAVPGKAISREGGRKVVMVLEGGKSVARPIKTGWKDSRYTEVLEGVKEGDLVIIGDGQQAEKK
ncbi:MAG: efflux RND transporter periplasmic adaptor subunit [Desulfurivibrionaceae bacterium]